MKTIATVKNPGKNTKTIPVNKKGKVAGTNSKTTKKKPQFSEILGQLGLPQPVNVTNAKKPENLQPETMVSHVKEAQTGVGSTTAKGKMAESTKVLADSAMAKVSHHVLNKAETSSRSENTIKDTAMEDSNGLKIMTSSGSSEKTGKELKPNQVNKIESNLTDKIAVNLKSDEIKHDRREIKIADLIMTGSVKLMENLSPQYPNKNKDVQAEVPLSSIKSTHASFERSENKLESSNTRDREAGSGSTGGKNQIPKTEFTLNVATGENVVLQPETAEQGKMSAGQTTLSKTQTDYLVSKMIQQINVAPSSLEVSLKPEYLGKVSILVQSLEGAIAVNVIAQNPEAMNLLNSNLQNIKDSLVQQGIDVQQMEVNLAFQEKQGNQSGNYKGERQVVKELDAVMDFVTIPLSEQDSLSSSRLNLLA